MKTGIATHVKTLITLTWLSAKNPNVYLPKLVLSILLHQSHWRKKLNLNHQNRLSSEEIETRIWAFVVIMVTCILGGIVFALLYSVTFVVQPIKSMAPIDQAYTKMLNDIVLLIVGGIGGVIGKKGVGAVAQSLATPSTPTPSVTPSSPVSVASTGALPVWVNPPLDESWTPPPPPTTPPSLEDDHERELQAEARASVK